MDKLHIEFRQERMQTISTGTIIDMSSGGKVFEATAEFISHFIVDKPGGKYAAAGKCQGW